MNLGNLIVGGGAVARGYREQEETIRRARAQELKLQELNRANTQYRQARDEEQMANTGAAVAETANRKFGVGVRPIAPPVREKVIHPGVPVAKNVTTTLSPAATKPAAPVATEEPQMTQQDFLALPESQRKALLQQFNDRRGAKALAYGTAGRAGAGLVDLATMAPRGLGMIAQGVANSRLGRAVGLSDANDPANFVDYTTAPMGEAAQAGYQRNKAVLTEDDYLATLPSRRTPGRRGGSGIARAKNARAGLEVPGATPELAQDFDTAVAKVLQREGGYVNDPDDPGGETNFGISKRAYPDEDIANMTPERATELYKRDYWDAIGADELAPDVREMAFDAAVNQGVGFTQSALEQSGRDPQQFLALRKQRYDERVNENPSQQKFYNGWMGRLNEFAAGIGIAPQGPAPGAVATLASTGRPEAVSGPAAAPARGGAGSAGAGPAGTTVAPVAQPPGVAVHPAVAAAAPKSKAQFYLANPNAITSDMTAAQDARAQLVRMGNLQLNLRTAEGYAAAQDIKAKIRALDSGMVDLQGIQGVQDWEMANDPGRLEQALSIKTGQDVGVKMFTDGSVDVYINGKLAHENVDPGELKDQALSIFDEGYRAQKAERATESHKAALEAQIEQLKGGMETFRALAKAQIEGQSQLWVEKFKAENRGWDVKFSPNTDDIYLIPPGNRTPLVFNPLGREITMGDSKILLTGAKEIPGLDTSYFGGSKQAGEK